MKKMIQRVAHRYLLSSDEQMYKVVLFRKNPVEDSVTQQKWFVVQRASVPRLSVFLDMPKVKNSLLAFASARDGDWFHANQKGQDVLIYKRPDTTIDNRLFIGRKYLYKIEVNGKPLNKALYSQVIKHIEKY